MVNQDDGNKVSEAKSAGGKLGVKKRGIVSMIYLSHILTSWGDRMWGFAVGLYLVILYPESLQYAAIYGFTSSIGVIIGGPCIGKWVDRSSRLKAATVAITIQNGAVIVCAILLVFMLRFSGEIKSQWVDALFLFGIVLFAVIGELASVANKIAIEKDWIVVLAENNETDLSKMNAIMRTIDLTTSILAPAVVAQIIAFISKIAGAVFIAGWNLVSAVVEIYLLYKIFKSIPQLGQKNTRRSGSQNTCNSKVPEILVEPGTPTDLGGGRESKFEEIIPTPTGTGLGLSSRDFSDVYLTPEGKVLSSVESPNNVTPQSVGLVSSTLKLFGDSSSIGGGQGLYDKIVESLKGWPDYFNHPLRFAGFGLASLYMTVLGFDSITVGYIYSQGVNESLIGVLIAIGAISGILGSLSFPLLRKRLGKCAVGNFGFGFETICLVLCVVSIFVPGSPFVMQNLWEPWPAEKMLTSRNETREDVTGVSVMEWNGDFTSVIIFISGILASRYGLWIADLSVTQFFQEEVAEEKRGILNGVQDSLNQALNLIKFVLVIILPTPSVFGYLIILSWAFVFFGWVYFMLFTCSWRRRSHKVSTNYESGSQS